MSDTNVYFLMTSEAKYFPTGFLENLFSHLYSFMHHLAFAHFFELSLSIAEEWGWGSLSWLFSSAFGG